MRWAWSALFLLLLGIGCNNYFLYHPTRRLYLDPERLGLDYEELYLAGVDNNSIHAWLFPSRSRNTRATLVQFHGNAENLSSHYLSLLWLTRHDFELFTFDYRGYGRSDGEPHTRKIIADAKLVVKFLQARNQSLQRPLILYGQSLGGILAARTLGELDDRSLISGIVIEGSFASYRSIGKQVAGNVCLPLGYLGYLLLSDEYAVREILPQLSPIPVLVVHGTDDPIAALRNGREIFALAQYPKYFLEIPGGGHLNWHNKKIYAQERQKLRALLRNLL